MVDDHEPLAQALSSILTRSGYQVVVSPTAENLLALIAAEKPQLMLLDIMMPKVDGLTLLERLKEDERFRDLPVLMMSSMDPEDATVRSLGLGAADFLPKPIRQRELLARVEAHLRLGRAAAESRKEASNRAAMVEILHEITDSLKPDEIYNILVRRVARVLSISKCSIVLAKPGDKTGVVVASFENPMLRNLEIDLARYPEIERALAGGAPVLVSDVATDPLYESERRRWQAERITVPTRSAVAV
ncbi:MAG: response regulator, partial [Acidobacteriota bacterium]